MHLGWTVLGHIRAAREGGMDGRRALMEVIGECYQLLPLLVSLLLRES